MGGGSGRGQSLRQGTVPQKVTGAEARSLAPEPSPSRILGQQVPPDLLHPGRGWQGPAHHWVLSLEPSAKRPYLLDRVIELVDVNLNLLWPSCHHEGTGVYTTKE